MFERLARRILDRLPSRRPEQTRTSLHGLHRTQGNQERTVLWQDIDRVVADLSKQLVGDTQILVFALTSGGAMTVTETDPAWPTLIATLPEHLPGSQRAATWQLTLIGTGKSVEVYRR